VQNKESGLEETIDDSKMGETIIEIEKVTGHFLVLEMNSGIIHGKKKNDSEENDGIINGKDRKSY